MPVRHRLPLRAEVHHREIYTVQKLVVALQEVGLALGGTPPSGPAAAAPEVSRESRMGGVGEGVRISIVLVSYIGNAWKPFADIAQLRLGAQCI